MQKKLPRLPDRGMSKSEFNRRVSDALEDLKSSADRGDLQFALVRRSRSGFRFISTREPARRSRVA